MKSNTIWNTGVNDYGKPLPLNSPDAHWRLIQGPGVTNPQNVYVLANQQIGTYFETQDSRWVWAAATGQGETTSVYVFQTDFVIDVGTQHWLQISGRWGADNFGQLTIDRNPLPPGSGSGEISLPAGKVPANYKQTHDFSISQAHPFSLSRLHLNPGSHTLEVWVYNEGAPGEDDPIHNPAGFNLSALHIDIHTARLIPPPPHPGP